MCNNPHQFVSLWFEHFPATQVFWQMRCAFASSARLFHLNFECINEQTFKLITNFQNKNINTNFILFNTACVVVWQWCRWKKFWKSVVGVRCKHLECCVEFWDLAERKDVKQKMETTFTHDWNQCIMYASRVCCLYLLSDICYSFRFTIPSGTHLVPSTSIWFTFWKYDF